MNNPILFTGKDFLTVPITIVFILLSLLFLPTLTPTYSISLPITIYPSTLNLVPGETANITITYSGDDYVELYFKSIDVDNNGSSDTVAWTRPFGVAFKGPGQKIVEVVTSYEYMGTYDLNVVTGAGETVGTITLNLVKPPRGVLKAENANLTIREMKFPFKARLWFGGEETYYIISDKISFTVNYTDLNAASVHSWVKTSSELGENLTLWTANVSRGKDYMEISFGARLKKYSAEGTYHLWINATQTFYLTSYDSSRNTYVVIGSRTYNISQITLEVEVKNVPPPEKYATVNQAYFKKADYVLESDNCFYVMKASYEIYVDISEIIFDDTYFYGIDTDPPVSINPGITAGFSINSATTTAQHDLEKQPPDCTTCWIHFNQWIEEQTSFPYLKIKRTVGTIHSNLSVRVPLNAYLLGEIARTKGGTINLDITRPTPDWQTFQGLLHLREPFNWVYDPPFYAVVFSEMKINNTSYNLDLHKLSGALELDVNVRSGILLGVERIIGDRFFNHMYRELNDMHDSSHDTAVLVISVELEGQGTSMSWSGYYPIDYLSENNYGPYIIATTNTSHSGTIEFLAEQVNNTWIPSKYPLYYTSGNISLKIPIVFRYLYYDDIEPLSTLTINISLADRFFNKTLITYARTYDIAEDIRILLRSLNKPPSGQIISSSTILSVGETARFGSRAEDEDGYIKHITWLILDSNNTVVYRDESLSMEYTFQKPGEYKVVMILEDDAGVKVNVTTNVQVLGLIELYSEKEIKIGGIPQATLANPAGGIWTMSIRHKDTGINVSVNPNNPLSLLDLLKAVDPDILPGEYFVLIRISGGTMSRFKTDLLAPPIFLRLRVVKNGEIHVYLEETWNSWTTINGEWGVVKYGADAPIDITYGAKLRFRMLELWEKLYIAFAEKFLEEAGFTQQMIKETLNFKIEYLPLNKIVVQHYKRGTMYLAEIMNYYLRYLKAPGGGEGWYYGYNQNRSDDALDSFYHELGHRIKDLYYNPSKMTGVFNHLLILVGTGGQHSYYKPFPSLFGSKVLSAIGAFEEAHSEFFATLVVEYIRGIQYYNVTMPVLPRSYFYDKYFEDHVLMVKNALHGPRYEGYRVEGRLAAALLDLLYGTPPSSVGTRYRSDPEKAVQAYKIFYRAMIYAKKTIKRTALTGREIIYFILLQNPWLYSKAYELNKPDNYNLMLTINDPSMITGKGTVEGANLLVYTYKETLGGYLEARYALSQGKNTSIYIGKDILALFKPNFASVIKGYGTEAKLIITDEKGELVFNATVWFRDGTGEIAFFRNSIGVYGAARVFIEYARGHTRKFYVKGINVIIIPHSTILYIQTEKNSTLYVLEGEITIQTTKTNKTLITNHYVVIDDYGGIIEENIFNPENLDQWWIIPEDYLHPIIEEALNTIQTNNTQQTISPRQIIANVEIIPAKTIIQGSSFTVKIMFNAETQHIGEYNIKLKILGENGEVLIEQELVPAGNMIQYTYRTGLLEHGKRIVEVYIGDQLIYRDEVIIQYNYSLILGGLASAILTVLLIAYALRRRRHRSLAT